MLSKIIDDYRKNLPKEIPAAILRSGAGSACSSILSGESAEQVFQKAIAGVFVSAFNSCVSAPIAGALFSDKSMETKDSATLAISVLTGVSLTRLSNQNGPFEFRWSGVILAFIANTDRKPGGAFTFVW